jgi:hypothetical protein
MANPRIGGSFAPPLSDEKLAQYRTLIEAMPESPAKDTGLLVLACCEKWWELPASKSAGSPHPIGVGTIVNLDEPLKKELWDYIPWTHDLNAMVSLFDEVQRDVTISNSRRVDAWGTSVREAVKTRYFPDPAELQKALNLAENWDKVKDSFAPDVQAKAQDTVDQVAIMKSTIVRAFQTKTFAGIAYPTLDPAPTRDALFHLLWFAKELDLDREPITNDMI